MDADTHFQFVIRYIKSRLSVGGHRATGERHADAGGALVDLVAKCFAGSQICAGFSQAAHAFFYNYRAGHAAAAGGVGAVDDGTVVGGEYSGMFERQHLGGHLKVHDVARIVLDDEQHAFVRMHGFSGSQHLVWRRAGKHLAGAGGIQHAFADIAGM